MYMLAPIKSKKEILIIDDDVLVSDPYAYFLRRSGFRVRTVEDCIIAEEKIREIIPDLIILDLVMPGKLNGFDFLNILTRSKAFKGIPVIVVSSLGRKEDIKICKKLGAASYMIKSQFSMKEIIQKARELTEK